MEAKNLMPQFVKETGTPEEYDPDGDKESGYYSLAFWRKYASWLELNVINEWNAANLHNKPSVKTLTLEKFRRDVRKWHNDLLYMPSLDYLAEHIYVEYVCPKKQKEK